MEIYSFCPNKQEFGMSSFFNNFKCQINFILIVLILTACGGGGNHSNTSKATITFSVDEVLVSQKKSKDSTDIKEVSITDLEGNEIATATEIEPRKYEVEVDKDISLNIKITLVNSNDGEITLERIIEVTKSEEITVDQESTHIATYIRESAAENKEEIKAYLESRIGEIDKIKKLLDEISNKEYINNLLEASNTQDLDQLSETIAAALKELERVNTILERIQSYIENFQNGSNEVESTDDKEPGLSLEIVADQIEGQDPEGDNETTIEIGENGELVVTNSEGTKNITTEVSIEKEPIVSGETISSNAEGIVIGSKSETGIKEIALYNNGKAEYITNLLKNIHPGDYVVVKYEENDAGEKIIAKITGSGTTLGSVSAIAENGLTLVDDNNYATEFTARYLTNESTGVSGFDADVVAFLAKLKVDDKVKIRWEINERKRIMAIAKITDTVTEEPVIEEPINEEPGDIEPESLTFTGKVTEKSELGFTITKAENDYAFIYINKEIAYHKEILAGLLIGDAIIVVAHKSDGYILDSATGEGSMSGTIIEKSETAIYVKNADGNTVKFTPEWHDGGLDSEMLAKFKELEVGVSITVKWKLEERKRAISITLN